MASLSVTPPFPSLSPSLLHTLIYYDYMQMLHFVLENLSIYSVGYVQLGPRPNRYTDTEELLYFSGGACEVCNNEPLIKLFSQYGSFNSDFKHWNLCFSSLPHDEFGKEDS